MEETLKSGADVVFTPWGVSMCPTIKGGRDTVVLSKNKEPLNIGDLIFYKREKDVFVLHRIVGKDKDGFILCGDSQTELEKGSGCRDS